MDNLDTHKAQQSYYEDEWSNLKLKGTYGKSGWRTTVPAPDFVAFVAYLKARGIKGRVLDVGCGGGRHTILLAKEGFDTYGIDFSASAVAVAKENSKKVGLSIDFVTGNVLDLPYQADFFTVVNDDGCLHHVNPAQWGGYLGSVTKVLQSDGILRIKAFSKNCKYYEENARSSSSNQWIYLTDSGYTYFFSESDIRNLFSKEYKITLEEKFHTATKDKKFFFVTLFKN